MRSLAEQFLSHWQQQIGVAPNALLGPYVSRIQGVLTFLDAAPDASKLKSEVLRIFKTPNWLLDPGRLQEFVQTVGEAQFWMLAKSRGVVLERIPEQSNKTPDFRAVGGNGNDAPCFEVKTLSVAEGTLNLGSMDESSFQAQLDLSRKAGQGERIAIALQEVAPHGQIKDGRYQTAIIRNLIDKATNNIKRGQYQDAPTCLVLNLLLIDAHYDGNASLRPVAFGYPEPWNVRSGAFWALAFGKVGHLVLGNPEFEGKPSVEGHLEREGVLESFPEVQALLLVIQPWNGEPLIYGLKRERDDDRWAGEFNSLANMFFKLVGKNWNDEDDTNGYALNQH